LPRRLNFGLTEGQKDKIIHRDRVPSTVWKNTAYDVRRWHDDVLDDLIWLYSPYEPKRQRTWFSFIPVDTIIPHDPKKTLETVQFLEDTIDRLERLKEAVSEYGITYFKRGR